MSPLKTREGQLEQISGNVISPGLQQLFEVFKDTLAKGVVAVEGGDSQKVSRYRRW
jgi:hypothetical protein